MNALKKVMSGRANQVGVNSSKPADKFKQGQPVVDSLGRVWAFHGYSPLRSSNGGRLALLASPCGGWAWSAMMPESNLQALPQVAAGSW